MKWNPPSLNGSKEWQGHHSGALITNSLKARGTPRLKPLSKLMQIRAYDQTDFPTVEQWAKARNIVLIPQLLGKNGFIIEDDAGPIAVAFVYLTFDVPLAFIDNLFTRPGTSIKQCREAWPILWRTVQAFLSNLRDCENKPRGYKVVRIFTRTPLARFLKADGWHVSNHTSTQAIYAIP